MPFRKILTYPNAILTSQTEDWRWLSPDGNADIQALLLKKVREDLSDTLEATDSGIAIAANQVGFRDNIFFIKTDFAVENNLPDLIVNPKIEWYSPDTTTEVEGCLSFPKMAFPIPRSNSIEVRFQDWKQVGYFLRLSGFVARMFQHEIDHLNGKLFVDFLPRKKKFEVRSIMLKRK